MKKSEIKDLYNQSNEALTLLKAYVKMLPFADGNKATLQAIDTAAHLVTIVKTMCDYMIDDGCTDMTARLQDIKAEAKQIELDVARMDYDKERFLIMLNCRAIINNIKDMEEWTANSVEPQQAAPEAPQQPSDGNSRELAGSSNETPPEGKRQTVIKKEDLPTIYDDENKVREQQVFYNAIQNNLMVLNADGKGYTWKTNGKLLALMCAILYWNDEIKKNTVSNDPLNTTFSYTLEKNNVYFEDAARLKEMFGGKDVSNYRTKLHKLGKLPENWELIDKLF
jgi:hypothetical protein